MSTYEDLRWDALEELAQEDEDLRHEGHTSMDPDCSRCEQDAEDAANEARWEAEEALAAKVAAVAAEVAEADRKYAPIWGL